nr:hypothetical protein [Tanacetum cinerariifolium]
CAAVPAPAVGIGAGAGGYRRGWGRGPPPPGGAAERLLPTAFRAASPAPAKTAATAG